MSTLATLTPNLAGRYVTVALTGLPAGKAIELTRTDTNGTRRVRVPRGAVADGGGAYTVRDYEAALTGSITYRVAGRRINVVTNPGFETDTSGWFASSGGVLTRDTTVVWNGAASGKFVVAAGSANLQMTTGTQAPAVPGEPWQIGVTVRGVTGTYQAVVINQDSTILFAGPVIAGADTWRFHQYAVTIPAGATTSVRWRLTVTAGTAYLDRVLLERAAAYDGYIEGTVDGPVTSAATTLEDAGRAADVWIHAAAYPTTLPVLTGGVVVGWQPTRDTGAQLVDIIGRADAIDTGPALARTRSHTIDVLLDSLADARQLEDLVAAARTVVVRSTTPGLDSTLTVESIDGPHPDPATSRRWHVVLRGRESLAGPYLADPPT